LRVTAPDLCDVRRTDAGLRARGRVPPELAFFDGHFPGRPVLAGFVQVDWALSLARDALGLTQAPAVIESLKFRSFLLPGQDFELSLETEPGQLRFEFADGDRVFSSGRVRLDDAVVQHAPAAAPPPAAAAGELPLVLPQTGHMRMLERVLSHAAGETVCETRIAGTTPLCNGGAAPAWLAVELLAQAMAAHGGIEARRRGASLRGFLVASRRIELRTRCFRVDERLWLHARHLRGELGMVAFHCALGTGAAPHDAQEAQSRAIASGRLTAFVERVAPEEAAP
jgi:predicted hotdog family 3-hydroxylacyl-ACP dehydratase/3-hydroxymyristoyl/3-hydroxydecanoyl-(acyl carrier protein) dehydratase